MDSAWILSVLPQPTSWISDQIILAAFDPNGTPQTYVLEYNSAHNEEYANLRTLITESFILNASSEQFSRLVHDNYSENLPLTIGYLPYLNWRNYRELYGEEALMQLLSALWSFADTGSASWDQYHDILSMTNSGLDGAYSEGLASIFETLFLKNPDQFLSVINSVYITDVERERVATYVTYHSDHTP